MRMAIIMLAVSLLLGPVACSTSGNVTTTCGASAIRAVLGTQVQDLATCAGFVGSIPTPNLRVTVGEEVSVEGAMGAMLISQNPDVVLVVGKTLRALQAGVSTVEVGGLSCVPVAAGQPATCALVRLTVS